MSQGQLGKLAGMSQSTISELENDEYDTSGYTARLADALGVESLWLETGKGKRPDFLLLSSDIQKESETSQSSPHKKTMKGMTVTNLKVASVSRLKTVDEIYIPQYDTGGAMGFGLALADQPGVIQRWTVNKEWLDKNARNHTGVSNLCIVTGFGDSMRPMYNPGDPLLVDTGVKTVEADGIYFFRIGDDGFIKRLQRIPEEDGLVLWAISQNKDYKDFPITAKMDFEVLGKVIRVWCGTDF